MKQNKNLGIIYGVATAVGVCFIYSILFDDFMIGLAVGIGAGMIIGSIGISDSNDSEEEE